MAGINYSKWDSLEVSDSEDEEDAASRAVLAQEHREMEEAAASQRKLRELITEHESGKPLEPPEDHHPPAQGHQAHHVASLPQPVPSWVRRRRLLRWPRQRRGGRRRVAL